MIKPWGAFIALSIFGFSAVDSSAGQTFNCDNASKSSERAICDHENLIKLDEKVAVVYLGVIRQIPKDLKRQIRWEQKAWLVMRNKCGYSSGCIKDSYNNRLNRLSYWQQQYKTK